MTAASVRHTPGPWAVAEASYGWDHFAAIVTQDGIVATCHLAALSRDYSQTAADAHLIAAAPELLDALRWALPLAERAMDDHRMERIRCGHSDISGTYKNGVTWAGIHQSEVDQIEAARAAIAKATPTRNDEAARGERSGG